MLNGMQSNVEYHGIVQRRRCLGKHLAFADILIEQGQEDENHRVVKVAFRRELIQSPPSDDFPVKKSSLPYSAKIQFTCQAVAVGSDKSNEPHNIITWKLMSDPREEAVKNSTVNEQNGISCTAFFRARRDAFDAVNQQSHSTDKVKVAKENTSSLPSSETNSHGNNQTKARRAKVFAQFILENLLGNDGSDQVLDVAGGKGFLSLELARQANIPATVIDPLIRKPLKNDKRVVNPPRFVHAYFDLDESNDLIASHSCLVGLHPDECTEIIVDAALLAGKSVAIVPCCVFPSLFPMRQLKSGKSVRTYEDFVDFLVQKDSSLQKATLPFDGKNVCIYRKV